MRVIIEFNLDDWETFKKLIQYLITTKHSFNLHTIGELEMSDLEKEEP